MNAAPRILFVPVSGAKGAGEYFRCLTIAQRVRERWPSAEIRFMVSRAARYAHEVPFPTVLIDRSPTYESKAVNRAIDDLRPGVVIFDNAGRVAQLRHARRCGARTVYVSSRPTTRWKGFRMRRMWQMDQHWISGPKFLNGELSAWEKVKLSLIPSVSIVHLDSLFPPPDETRALAYRRDLGLVGDSYLLFCAGGGGHEHQGLSASDVFGRAALEVARASGQRTVWVQGPNYTGALAPPDGLLSLGALSGPQLIDLLSGARIAITNGGSLLSQALALRVPCIAAPVAGDQDARIETCAARGLLLSTTLEVDALVQAVMSLLKDPAQLDEIRVRLGQLDLNNGVDVALAALERLLNESSAR
jgi:hypothetical protein